MPDAPKDSFSRLTVPAVRRRDELEFLPAALEVLDTPPPPVGRWIAFLIAALAVLAVVWATLGTIDVVAVATGRVVPNGHVKVIQPLETGIVRSILVEEGGHVRKGQALVELDPTDAAANVQALEIERQQALLGMQIQLALLDSGEIDAAALPAKLAPERLASAETFIAERRRALASSLSAIEYQIEGLRSAVRASNVEIDRLTRTIPLAEEQTLIQQTLLDQGLTRKTLLLDLRQRDIERKAQLEAAVEQRSQSKTNIEALKERESEITSSFRADALEKLQEFRRQIAVIDQRLLSERRRELDRILRSPVHGFVNQLAIATIGGVVTTADTLMIVVPDDVPLQVETNILNKDIGFVRRGQPVEIKLDAFPFTRYGLVHGTLTSISSDAISDEELGPIYRGQITLDSETIVADGKKLNLSPGMAVVAEIKTGKRHLIEFFLSPLLRYRQESLRER